MIFTGVAYAAMWRAGGIGIGFGGGWNFAVLGPIATRLSHVDGVVPAVVGAFVTVQFVMHMLMQIPGGRAADRWGAKQRALLGMTLVMVGNALSLPAPHPSLAFAGRAVIGTGVAVGGGSDYIRVRGGGPLLQGLYGGSSVLAPGSAVAVVPLLAGRFGWRAGYESAIVVCLVCLLILLAAPATARAARHAGERLELGFFRDRELYRLAAEPAMSFGFSVVVGNGVVTLHEHHGHGKAVAGAAGALTLL